MGRQEGVLLNSVVYQKVSNAFEGLRERSETSNQGHFDVFSDYRVLWESTGHSHPTTSYAITGFGEELGEPTLQIRGAGGRESGGNYEIIPKPDNPPWIRYHRKDGYTGWDEELRTLMIVSPDCKYVNDGNWQGFFEKAYSIIEEIKRN
jgi:hypothetical protein